jgi:hypothetical protein
MNVLPVALLLFVAAPLDRLSGTVLDPQGLAVPGARVSLTCDGRSQTTVSDERGRFVVVADAFDGCSLVVEHPGFERVHQIMTPENRDVAVRLMLAAVRQIVQVNAAPPPQSPFALRLEESDFHRLAANTADLIERTRVLAGATTVPVAIYVDGLPQSTLPPLDRIASISINADPFSAEYNDGDMSAVHIVTKAPARTVRVDGGTDPLTLGGHSVLEPRARSDAASVRIGVSAPVPRLPLTFSAHMTAGRTTTALPLRLTLPAPSSAHGAEDPVGASNYGDVAVDVHYAAPDATRASVSVHDRRFRSSNLGVGGLMAEESGYAASFGAVEARAALARAGNRLSYEAGAIVSTTDSSQRANTATMGVSVPGFFVLGGASVTASDAAYGQWTIKQVVRSSGDRPWSAGLAIARSAHATDERANAAGLMVFETIDAYRAALAGDPTGTLFVTRGDVPVTYASTAVAPFAQKILVRTNRVEIIGGLRGDYQQRFGGGVLPRLSAAATWGGYTVRVGAGLFARPIPDAVVLAAIAGDGFHRNRWVATGTPLTAAAFLLSEVQGGIRVGLADDITRPRQTMARTSIERRIGRLTHGIEYTWSEERHRLGADRTWQDGGWWDTITADRVAGRQRLHSLASVAWARQQLAVHYEWVRARDNGDGPWSHPERPADLENEWAPSAGVAPHNVTVTGFFMLPGAVSLNVTDVWASGAPYNVTTGLDVAGNLLYVDRGGRPRNSGEGTPSNVLSLYGYRRIAVPAARGVNLGIGVQGTNLLNNRNYTNWGAVAGTPSFGLPLSAQSGRALRIFFSVS